MAFRNSRIFREIRRALHTRLLLDLAIMATALILLPLSALAATGGQCGTLLPGQGFADNLPGKPTKLALSAADCCAFCHATPGCAYWTWNGLTPGNGLCYAKASDKSGTGSATMVSGGTTAGPPLPPPPPVAVAVQPGHFSSSTLWSSSSNSRNLARQAT